MAGNAPVANMLHRDLMYDKCVLNRRHRYAKSDVIK